MGDSTDMYIEVLDGSRIHPENYTYARKMAKDSQGEGDEEEDDDDEQGNTKETEAIEKVLENPNLLDSLDLESFNADLISLNVETGNYMSNKIYTLYQIKQELSHRFRDKREPPVPLQTNEKFYLLTGENDSSIHLNKLVTGTVAK